MNKSRFKGNFAVNLDETVKAAKMRYWHLDRSTQRSLRQQMKHASLPPPPKKDRQSLARLLQHMTTAKRNSSAASGSQMPIIEQRGDNNEEYCNTVTSIE